MTSQSDAFNAAMRTEFELIERYFAPLARAFPGAYGLRDDAAVISPAAGNELVVKTDTIVERVDFPPGTRPDLIARRGLRVNLSDLAAKGAVPRAYLLSLLLPDCIDEGWVAAFAEGLAQDQAEYGVHLIGGDMSSTSGPIAVTVGAFGEAPVGSLIRRGGAQPNDLVFVTGTVGDAALGLSAVQGRLAAADEGAIAFLVDRYRLPRPRVALGPHLIGIATAGIDISDGLVADLRHVCEVSRLTALIDSNSLPLSPAARAVVTGDAQRLMAILTGGDDYEVLFTAPAGAAVRVAELSRSSGVPITCIGRTATPSEHEEPHVAVINERGARLTVDSEGWTHFGKNSDRRI